MTQVAVVHIILSYVRTGSCVAANQPPLEGIHVQLINDGSPPPQKKRVITIHSKFK